MARIKLAPGTSVSFRGDTNVYQVDYQELIGPCPPDCTFDHDCYPEAYVSVWQRIGTAKPVSRLHHVFDDNGLGHEVNPADVVTDEPEGRDESMVVFDDAFEAAPAADGGGSGIPRGYDFHSPAPQLFAQKAGEGGPSAKDALFVFLPEGGMIAIYRDGTWAGDLAPFSD